MASRSQITLTHDKDTTVDLKAKLQCPAGQPRHEMELVRNFLEDLAVGVRHASMDVTVDDGDAVAASGTVTFSSLANNDTVTVGAITFTAKTSGASGAAQFNLGASDTTAATAFAAAVNAHASLINVVSASPAAAVTTITCAQKGLIGNNIALAISAHGTVSAAFLASGTNYSNGVTNTYKFGM